MTRENAGAIRVPGRFETPRGVLARPGRLGCMEALLEAGASTAVAVEGSPALHTAVVMGALPAHRQFCSAAVPHLLKFGADPCLR